MSAGHAILPSLPTLPVAQVAPLPGVPGATGTAASTIPGAVPSSTGQGTGVGTIPTAGTSISPLNLTQSQGTTNSNSLLGDFQATYGQGTGTALATTLSNLGTSTDNAVTATNQSILNAAGIQQANLEAGDAAAGLSKDSSSSALALGDFNSQVSQNIATTDSQMELSEENELIQSLFQEGGAHGSDSSFLGSLGDFLQGGGLESIGETGGEIGSAYQQANPSASGGLASAMDVLATF